MWMGSQNILWTLQISSPLSMLQALNMVYAEKC